MLTVRHEEILYRFTNNFETLLELCKVYLCGWDFFTKNMVFMLTKESTVRTYFLVVAGLTHQFLYLAMLQTIFAWWNFFIILPIINRILLYVLYHIDHNHVFGYIFTHIFTNHYLSSALIANVDSSIRLYTQTQNYALFAKCMTTFWYNSRDVIVEIVLLMT